MLIPSAYFAYNLYEQQKFSQSVNDFIKEEFTIKGNTVIFKKTSYNSNPKLIELAFVSNLSEETIEDARAGMSRYGISDTKLIVMQDTNVNMIKLKNDILNEVKTNEIQFSEKESRIKLLEDSIAQNRYDHEQLLKEVNSLYPEINSISIANHTFYTENDKAEFNIPVFIYDVEKDLIPADKNKLQGWLKSRLKLDSLEMYKKD